MAGTMITRQKVRTGKSPMPNDTNPATSHENLDWFLANAKALLAKYPDHWLAIRDLRVIDSDPSVKALRESLNADSRSGYIIVRSKEGSTTVHR